MRASAFSVPILLAAGFASGQTPVETANLIGLTDRLQSAIDAEDWPREWYTRRGFTELARSHSFLHR